MAKKSKPQQKVIANRRARYDYELHQQLTVGLALSGPEVRAARSGHVGLRGAYVTIKNNELWLINASFSLPATSGEHDTVVDTRTRKLLATRKEIQRLIAEKERGLTIVPLSLMTGGRHIKLIISTAKGKKLHDKRETIKRRDSEREAQRAMKQISRH